MGHMSVEVAASGQPLIEQPLIDLRDVSQRVRTGELILHGISLSIGRGELVAIIGGSGTGKTTLLDTMCGLRPPAAGQVHRDGEQGRHGYVPQDDIIHLALPLRRTLRYTAGLRLPVGTTPGQAEQAVTDVLKALELADRADLPVGQLSGGQRKRASIAAELLTRPGVFFLDEPTSGLDPARGAELMRILRQLASEGTTVVLTTHNPLDAERCDKVAVLAEHGYLAFFGSPGRPARTSGPAASRRSTSGWPARIRPRPGAVGSPRPRLRPSRARRHPPRPPLRPRARFGIGSVRQWLLLTRRNAEILARSRLTLAILLGSPVMVLAMFVVLFKPHAFGPGVPTPGATVMILFWVAFGGFFFGLTYGLLQICAEFAVLRRERFVGLRAGPYVLAKVAVLLPLLAAVDAAFLVVLRALGRLPGAGDYGAVFGILLLSSAAALGLDLLISAAVSEPAQATIAMPMVCFPQVLFVGAILPVPVMAVVGRWISYAMSNRWAFEGLGHSLGVNRLWADGGSSTVPMLRRRNPRHQAPRTSRQLRPNAHSPAPGLQKQPLRTEMPAALVSRATARSSTTTLRGSRKLKATVPPRAWLSLGPYNRTIGAPSACFSAARQSSSQPVRYPTRR
jgi:ABC-type multidrug transport system ATPase subunit